jgi:hypothetical protein
MPLLGETTTAVLYPVRYAIGHLPMSAERQIAWYVVLHLILASSLARVAAARIGCGRSGRLVAGLTYPLSGCVFFLYCNPPFLVGAAWLPLALSMLITAGNTSARRRIALSSLALSMMVLAGDPQTALHVAMLCGLVTGFQVAFRKTHRRELGILIVSFGLAAAMAAPQIAATISWAGQSDRATLGISKNEAMQYSVAPWHFAELFTPNLFGTLFPINQRISALIANDGQLWTPTLFMGLLPAVMILDRLLRWRRTCHDVWLLISVLAALTATAVVTAAGQFAVYGWLHEYFPGYGTLRYPAKWLPFLAIGLSIAFSGWIDDRAFTRATKAFGLTAILLSLAVVFVYWFPVDLGSIRTDKFWGPLDLAGARDAILLSLAISFACLMLYMVAFWKLKSFNHNWMMGFIIFLLVIELSWSASNQLQTVSIDAEQRMIQGLVDDEVQSPKRLLKMQTTSTWPDHWKNESSEDRMLQVEAQQRAGLFGRWHLMSDHSVVNNFVSIRSGNHALFWRSINKLLANKETVNWNSIQQWLAIDHAVIQSNGRLLWRPTVQNPEAVEVLSNWTQRTAETDFHQRIKDIAGGKVAEAHALTDLPDPIRGDKNRAKARIQHHATWVVKDESPERMLVEIDTDQPVLLVRPIFQDSHWIAERRSMETEGASWKTSQVGQVDLLKQGTVVPPGRWEIRFSYRPWWWMASIGIAMVGWFTAGMYFIRQS